MRDTQLDSIKNEHYESWRDRPLWAIIDLPDGSFGVYPQTLGSAGPMTTYPTKRKAVARLLQLMETGPVAPQTWPERICVGSATTSSSSDDED